jgi:NAD(P)H-dependent FMN reductase
VLKLEIIVGSTRPTRSADVIMPWVERRAREHGGFDVDVLDLRNWPLPMFAEHPDTIGDRRDPTYSDPIVKSWNAKIKQGEAYLVVTPEYNHSVPGVLKNAIDNVFVSFGLRNKPMVAIGYSGGIAGGTRAVEHLAHIAIEAEAAPLRNTVIIPFIRSAFGEDGDPRDPATETALAIALDDLAWWGHALKRARAEGELPPGSFRARAAAGREASPRTGGK